MGELSRYITDEQNGLNYKLVGDYYLPMIKAPDVPEIGVWGRRYLRYLKVNRKAYYTTLLLSGKLFDQATEIDRTAEEMYEKLIRGIALQEGINEQLKSDNQMEWVRSMNSIRNRAEEVVLSEMLYQ